MGGDAASRGPLQTLPVGLPAWDPPAPPSPSPLPAQRPLMTQPCGTAADLDPPESAPSLSEPAQGSRPAPHSGHLWGIQLWMQEPLAHPRGAGRLDGVGVSSVILCSFRNLTDGSFA